MRYIVARNYCDAFDFARAEEWLKSGWRYINRPHSLCGLQNVCIYLVGPWWQHPDGHEIKAELDIRQGLGKITIEEVYDWR